MTSELLIGILGLLVFGLILVWIASMFDDTYPKDKRIRKALYVIGFIHMLPTLIGLWALVFTGLQ